MRPLQLKMHHFGPFLDETIDFSRLGHELFLITGPTGSGKTTIFDGMCYALYGEGSNSFRQSREMKSQFGDPLETMWVEFVFTLKNKTYKIRRIPEQERRRARGEGTALQKHEAAFYEIAGEEERLISASVEEIRSLVPQLLGINASQFRQIIMLPQGEFSRLLKAPVDERVELLKSIFRMDLYQKLREKMGARLKAAREQCSLLGTQIASEREHVAAEDHQILAQALAEGVDTAYLLTLMTTAIDEDTALLQGLSEDDADLQKRIQGAQTLLAAAKQINARFDSLKAYKDKQAKLDEQAGEMDQLEKWLAAAEAALRVRPVEETLIAVQQKLLAAQREVSEIEGQWSELADRAEGLRAEAARVTAQDFERSLENLRRLSEVRAQMMEKWQLWDEKRLAQSRQAERITALAQRWEGVRTAAQALEGQRECCQDNEKQRLALVEEGRGLSWEIKTQGEMLDKLAEITEGFDKIAEMEKVIGQLRESFRRARQDAQKKQAVLDEAKVNHRAHLAATLAEKLSEGAPCPVCGSVHHPQKPLPPENFVDDAAQKALEDEAQKALQHQDKLALQGKAKAEERERTQQELQQKIDHLGLILPDRQAVEVKIAEAGAEVQALKEKAAQNTAALDDLRKKAEADAKRLSDLEAVSQRGEGLEAELQSARGLGEQLLGQVKTLAEQLDQGLEAAALGVSPEAPEFMEVLKKALGESQKAYAQQLEHKEKTLREAQNLNEALAALESQRNLRTQDVISFKAEAQKAESAFETALKTEALALSDYKQYRDLSRASLTAQAAALKNYEFEVKETAGRVEELEAELLDKTPMDLAEGEAQRENLRTEEEALRERLEAVHRRLEINRRQCEKLGELSERLTQAEKQLGICQQLDETLKGTVKGKAKISFERYILSAYLQDILESANVFLEDMSAGRYRLEVMTEGGGRGLDIEVVDAYTGLKRSANTLSGGETFMAALSMALGLSDSVQSAAGGISLETIFIDEGFATLDPEALDKAISCLLAIKDDGRMVGLISHVEELKERIDTKITVTKTESGSHIEY